jgi:uncharacterized membrane protein
MTPAASFDPTLDRAPPSARLLRSLGLLGLSGASVALAGQFVSMRATLPKFISTNDLPKSDRSLLLVAIAIGALVPQLLVAIVWLFRRGRTLRVIETSSRLLSPAIVAAALPPLLCLPPWRTAPLDFLALLSVVVVLANVTIATSLSTAAELARRASTRTRVIFRPTRFVASTLERPRVALGTVALAGLAYGAYTAYLTIVNFRRLSMGAYDMGVYANQMFNSLHGHPFRNTIMFGPKGGSSLAAHAEFGQLLFLPLYAVHPGPEILLILQAALLGLAAIPLFLCAETLISRRAAAVVAIGYLLFAPLHGAAFHDFHWLTITPFFVFLLFYAIRTDKSWLALSCVIALVLISEDAAVGVAAIGLFVLATRTRPRLGVGLVVFGVICLALDKFLIARAAANWRVPDIDAALKAPGESGYWSTVRTLVTNPSFLFTTLLTEKKCVHALHLFAPLAFLPVRRALLLPLLVPGFLFTLMATDQEAASIANQGTIHWIPYLFIGTVLALQAIHVDAGRAAATAALSAAALGIVAHSLVFGVLFYPDGFHIGSAKAAVRMTAREAAQYRGLRVLVDGIPRTASVMATDPELPFVATRLDAYSAALYDADASYALIHAEHFTGDAKKNFGNLFSRHAFGLVDQQGKAFLFKRGDASPGTEAALQGLGIAPKTVPPG